MNDEIKTSAEAEEDAVMPRSHTVRCNPDGSITSAPEEIPDAVTKKPVKQKSPAEWAYERIILYIQNFEKQLDNEHEVAMGFAGGDMGVMRIEGLGFFDPDIVTFYGSDQVGAKTQLIQHVTQLNVMLRALPKEVTKAEPSRIGFRLAADLKDSEADT
ncbi:DUF6173 family protein [Aliiroseovarius sp. YM-037]|uniref:DUF6173 family protein n=1 Tax=Aliiroseovarius sp. YM-037 TaxID=3341728 RepID=UPI003A801497